MKMFLSDINDKTMLDDFLLELEELQQRLKERMAEQRKGMQEGTTGLEQEDLHDGT